MRSSPQTAEDIFEPKGTQTQFLLMEFVGKTDCATKNTLCLGTTSGCFWLAYVPLGLGESGSDVKLENSQSAIKGKKRLNKT